MVIRLENTSGRHNKFYELICEYWHITTRFGAIYSVCPTFFLLNFALIQIFQLFGGLKDSGLSSMVSGIQQVWQLAQALPGDCGIAGTELYSSRAGYLEHIFSKLQEKLAGGYKIVFPGPLPPPVSPDVPTLAPPVPKGSKASRGRGGSTVASRGVKRKTASTPPAKEPPAGVRRSKRARKESEKQKEAREKKDEKQAEKKAKQEEKEKEQEEAEKMNVEEDVKEKEDKEEEEKEKEQEQEKEKEQEKTAEEEKGKEKEPEKEAETDSATQPSIEFPWKLKSPELKAELEARGLPSDGKKDVLTARLCMTLLGFELPGTSFLPPHPNNYFPRTKIGPFISMMRLTKNAIFRHMSSLLKTCVTLILLKDLLFFLFYFIFFFFIISHTPNSLSVSLSETKYVKPDFNVRKSHIVCSMP